MGGLVLMRAWVGTCMYGSFRESGRGEGAKKAMIVAAISEISPTCPSLTGLRADPSGRAQCSDNSSGSGGGGGGGCVPCSAHGVNWTFGDLTAFPATFNPTDQDTPGGRGVGGGGGGRGQTVDVNVSDFVGVPTAQMSAALPMVPAHSTPQRALGDQP